MTSFPKSSPHLTQRHNHARNKADALRAIRELVGVKGWVDDPALVDAYVIDARGYFRGRAAAVVRPSSTEEVARVLDLCHEAGLPIVPQGGNTGLCGGATPDDSGGELVLCLSRLNRVRGIDTVNFTMTVEAGVVLERIHRLAAEHDLMFPLDLAAKGSCQIGGNLATNAGGINVVRFGNARDLVLGLEVVLPDGTVWNGLSELRKDNTGYDLKHLFMGSEGTLGVITAAVLKLFPEPRQRRTAFLAVAGPAAACEMLATARRFSGDAVVSFEYMPRLALELVIDKFSGNDPLDDEYEHYVLLELAAGGSGEYLEKVMEQIVESATECEMLLDGVVAQSEQQRLDLWSLREHCSDAQRESVKNDVSVPIGCIPEFLERAATLMSEHVAGARPCPFGHIGDGNMHYNVLAPVAQDAAAFRQTHGATIIDAVNKLVIELGGSFSAEHGVGKLRRDYMYQYKDPAALEVMRKIKNAIDPQGLLNPGKVL